MSRIKHQRKHNAYYHWDGSAVRKIKYATKLVDTPIRIEIFQTRWPRWSLGRGESQVQLENFLLLPWAMASASLYFLFLSNLPRDKTETMILSSSVKRVYVPKISSPLIWLFRQDKGKGEERERGSFPNSSLKYRSANETQKDCMQRGAQIWCMNLSPPD